MKTMAWAKLALTALVTAIFSLSAIASTDADTEALIERIKPVGSICVEGDESCAGAVVAAPAASSARSAEDIYNANCTACHSTGAAGAPRLGNAEEWAPHIDKGIETLYKHAIEGFNAMPARGLCMTCSDDEIHATVDYILNSVK